MQPLEREEDRKPTQREWTGFWGMIAQQTQNAFNDKIAQFTLVPLGGAVAFSVGGARVEDLAAVLIALPFILFAPLAGWLSDRFSKRDVMVGAAVAQLLILAGLCFAIRRESMPLACWDSSRWPSSRPSSARRKWGSTRNCSAPAFWALPAGSSR
jgi:acyl-[acyl-carrier-protein]-phospholipid O-acyltransferase/long-chain-fatty-acid--[acyl-carrier-protein] ligase